MLNGCRSHELYFRTRCWQIPLFHVFTIINKQKLGKHLCNLWVKNVLAIGIIWINVALENMLKTTSHLPYNSFSRCANPENHWFVDFSLGTFQSQRWEIHTQSSSSTNGFRLRNDYASKHVREFIRTVMTMDRQKADKSLHIIRAALIEMKRCRLAST